MAKKPPTDHDDHHDHQDHKTTKVESAKNSRDIYGKAPLQHNEANPKHVAPVADKIASNKQAAPKESGLSKLFHQAKSEGEKLLAGGEKLVESVTKGAEGDHENAAAKSAFQDAKQVAHADKMAPAERAHKGVHDYDDPGSKRHFHYNDRGLIDKVQAVNGAVTTIDYKHVGNVDRPTAFSTTNENQPQLLRTASASDKLVLKVDQQTGDVTSSSLENSPPADTKDEQSQPQQKVERHFSPEGACSEVRRDLEDHRLEKTITGFDGKVVAVTKYHYGQDGKEVGANDEATAEQFDARGRLTHRFAFGTAGDIEKQNPCLREDRQYNESSGLLKETLKRFDLHSGKKVKLFQSEEIVDLQKGRTTVQEQTFKDGIKTPIEDKTITFDEAGKPIAFQYKNELTKSDVSFDFTSNGKASDVKGTPGTVDKEHLLLMADVAVGNAVINYQVKAIDLTKSQGDKPTGTVVSEDAGKGDKQQQSTTDKQQVDLKAIDQAVQDIHDAKDNTSLLMSDPDKNKIWNTLEPMSAAQRQLVQENYRSTYHTDLSDDLRDQLSGPDFARAEAILKRQDGVADNTGQIHQALAKLEDIGPSEPGCLNDGGVRAEREIRDSINTLSADQLKVVEAKYKQDYGRSLASDLSINANLSDESKQALAIYIKGTDHRTDADTLKLADMAIQQNRPDIFNEVCRDASQSARDTFTTNGGTQKIDDSFGGGDAQIAKDHLSHGTVSIATIINGDTHWYHTNKDDITGAVTNASDQDRQDFMHGERLANSAQQPQTDADKRALEFYNSVDKSFHNSGNEREATAWAAKLRNNDSVITGILDAHTDGSWFLNMGDKTDKNKQMSAVESMNAKDWQYLRDHPEEVGRIDKALGTFSDSNHVEVMNMLNAKLAANDFTSSAQVGSRALQERLQDSDGNTGARVDALVAMSADERQRYAANKDGFKDQVNGSLKGDEEKFLANQLSQTTGAPTALEKVLIHGIKNDSSAGTFSEMEAAMKADPTLKDRLNNPVTDSDKQLSQFFHEASRSAVNKAGLGTRNMGRGGIIPGQYDKYDNAIFQDGHVPLDQQLHLTQDKRERIDIILSASDADKARLVDANPTPENKAFQDAVLGFNNDEKEIIKNALQQKDATTGHTGYLDQADQFRLFVVNGGDQNQLQQTLSSMTPEARQNLANEYFTKYHALVSGDVAGKVTSEEQWRFREMLSATDVNVRQIALDAQTSNDSHTSSWDGFMKDTWDYTRVSADSTADNLTKFMAKHGTEIDKLPPGKRKALDEAINNYTTAQKAYVDSKGQMSEALVNATITVAAIGGAAFSGGTSLELLSAVGAGGAVFRTTAMSSIEGTDFDGSASNVLKQGFEGGSAAMLGFLGPEALGLKGLSVGSGIAAVTTEKLLQGSATSALFKEGSEQILKEGLANVTREGAIVGDKEIAALAEKVAANGADKNIVEQAIKQQLKTDTMSGLRNIVLNEGESYARNMLAAQMGAQGKELLATAAGFESPDTLMERMKGTAISTASGVTFFHGIFRSKAVAGDYIRVSLGKDSTGNIIAGAGTPVRHADGSVEVVAAGKTQPLVKGDTIPEDGGVKQTNWGTAVSDPSGEVVQFETHAGRFQQVPGKPDTWFDPRGREVTISDVKVDVDGSLTYKQGDTTFKHDPQSGDYRSETPGKGTVEYHKDGSVIAVDDPLNHLRLEPQYSTNSAGQQELTSFKRYTVDASGTKSDAGAIEKRANGWTDVDAAGNAKTAYGTDMHVNADGTMSFTGEIPNKPPAPAANDAFVGQKLGDFATSEIAVAPDGSKVVRFSDGKGGSGEIASDAQNHLTHVVNGKGDLTDLQYDASGQPNKVTVDGHVYEKPPGSAVFIDQATGKPFADQLYIDPSIGQVSFRMDSSYRIPGQEGTSNEVAWITRWADGTSIIEYKSFGDGVRIPDQNFIPQTREANFKERINQGEVVSDGKGFKSTDGSGATVHYDENGRVIGNERPDGSSVKYKYGSDGKVESYATKAKDGSTETIQRDQSGNFERVSATGKHEPLDYLGHRVNDLTVESDGSVTQWTDTFEGHRTAPDGVEVAIDSLGHEHVTDAALRTERTHLENMSDTMFGGGEKSARMQDMMKAFEANAKKNGVSEGEIANTYYQVNKMLTANDAVLSLADRQVLSQQLMLSLAHPHTIDQGHWDVCNVTAEVQNRFAVSHPAELARLTADVSTSGRFVNGEGHVIDMTSVKGALTAQSDVLATMGQHFKGRTDISDIANYQDGQRNFLSQIIQTSLVNERWQGAPPLGAPSSAQRASTLTELRQGLSKQSDVNADFSNRYHPGDLRYEIQGKPVGAQAGIRNMELVTNYSVGGDGKPVLQKAMPINGIDPVTGKPSKLISDKVVDAPSLYNADLVQISRSLLGYDEPPHFFVRDDNNATGNVVNVTDENAFAQQLMDLKNAQVPGRPQTRGFPPTIYVDSASISADGVNIGGWGGAHVINVQDIWQDPTTGKWKVHITNQWGEKFDWVNRDMDLDTLWKYMDRSRLNK